MSPHLPVPVTPAPAFLEWISPNSNTIEHSWMILSFCCGLKVRRLFFASYNQSNNCNVLAVSG